MNCPLSALFPRSSQCRTVLHFPTASLIVARAAQTRMSVFQYGAVFKGVSGPGREVVAVARTNRSLPITLNTSGGCGKT